MFRQKSDDLLAFQNAPRNAIAPVITCFDLGNVKPDFVTACFKVLLDAFNQLSVITMGVAEEDFHGGFF